jgi:hypothetical protein
MDKLDEIKRELDDATDRIEILKALGLLNGGVWSNDLEAIRKVLQSMLMKIVSDKTVTMHDFAILSYALNEAN